MTIDDIRTITAKTFEDDEKAAHSMAAPTTEHVRLAVFAAAVLRVIDRFAKEYAGEDVCQWAFRQAIEDEIGGP